MLAGVLAVTVGVPRDATAQGVKKSTSGICHCPGGQFYGRTSNFTEFDTIDARLASVGRELLIPDRCLVLGLGLRIGQSEDDICHPPPERFVVHELLEELHVVVEHGSHHAPQRFVMFDSGVLPVGVLSGGAVGGVFSNLGRNLFRNEAANSILVFPGDIPRTGR